MAQENLGRVMIVPKGDYAPGVYKYLDLVQGDNGSVAGSFLSLQGNNDKPLSDTSYWRLIVKDGEGIMYNPIDSNEIFE